MDNANRLADLLGIGHQPMKEDVVYGKAADRITELESRLKAIEGCLKEVWFRGYCLDVVLKPVAQGTIK